MKRVLSISLLLIIVFYSFNQIGVFLEYIVDIRGYTELYCVNKDKPEIQCNGKCHLAKELADHQEQKEDKNLQILPEIILSFYTFEYKIKPAYDFIAKYKTPHYQELNLTKGISTSIFRPPQGLFV